MVIIMNDEALNREEEKEKLTRQINIRKEQYMCVLKWLELFEDKSSLIQYFKEHGCSRIAIYGAADMGRLLQKEIDNDGQFKVSYFIDKRAGQRRKKMEIPVFFPEEFADAPDADILVVTAISVFDEIFDKLIKIRQDIPIVSLNTIIDVMSDEVWYEQR